MGYPQLSSLWYVYPRPADGEYNLPSFVQMPTLELMSRPHWALSCHDILCTIFEQFVVAEDKWSDHDTSIGDANSWFARRADASRRRTLARCARVCKAFFAPAIAVLWRDVDNLSPLLNAMQPSLRSPAAAPMVSHDLVPLLYLTVRTGAEP